MHVKFIHRVLIAAVLAVISTTTWAKRSCVSLKADIAAKIEANGVTEYQLTIVPTAAVRAQQKVVGSCDGGTHKIIYKRGHRV